MTDEHEAMLKELTRIPAAVFTDTDEKKLVLEYTGLQIPQLNGGEIIEVTYRRIEKRKSSDPFPVWDMAGVVTP